MSNTAAEIEAALPEDGGRTRPLAGKADVAVVGAGAVGLFLAVALARRGLSVLLLEKRLRRDGTSRAIGISSPSLELLAQEGLVGAFLAEGLRVRGAVVSDGRRELGRLDFACVGGTFPFVLSLPQARTEALLEAAVRREKRVIYRSGIEVLGCGEVKRLPGGDAGNLLEARDSDGASASFEARVVVACDGKRGTLGPAAGAPARGHAYRDRFLMGDFPDATNWNDTARLFFTPAGSVESFPLPGGARRWVLSCERGRREDGGKWIAAEVRSRTGAELDPAAMSFESAFGVERRVARRWAGGGLFVAGDAAHLMSPIVGQNMNTGFADAAWLAGALERLFGQGRPPPDDALAALGRAYARARGRPTRAAADRAWAMMRLGTARGALLSFLRSSLVSLALSTPASRTIAGIFTMRSIPGETA